MMRRPISAPPSRMPVRMTRTRRRKDEDGEDAAALMMKTQTDAWMMRKRHEDDDDEEDDDDDARKRQPHAVVGHRRAASVSIVGGADAGREVVDLAEIKREFFSRTRSRSVDRKEEGLGIMDESILDASMSMMTMSTTSTTKTTKTTTMKSVKMETRKLESAAEYDATCPTCFEEYDEENPRIVLRCGHHFHLPCVLEWREYLELHGRADTCPACDAPIDIDFG